VIAKNEPLKIPNTKGKFIRKPAVSFSISLLHCYGAKIIWMQQLYPVVNANKDKFINDTTSLLKKPSSNNRW